MLVRLLSCELDRRDERRVRTSRRLSGLPPGMTLGESDLTSSPRQSGARSKSERYHKADVTPMI